ncbi:hypothetical protein C8J56DRAFT_1073011 [Mycena floridula]|nr:hypothetical protein C8J56DRAFT_1073011 [Mycena floridula]
MPLNHLKPSQTYNFTTELDMPSNQDISPCTGLSRPFSPLAQQAQQAQPISLRYWNDHYQNIAPPESLGMLSNGALYSLYNTGQEQSRTIIPNSPPPSPPGILPTLFRDLTASPNFPPPDEIPFSTPLAHRGALASITAGPVANNLVLQPLTAPRKSIDIEKARHLVGQSSASPTATVTQKPRAIVDRRPFLAPHGRKGPTWTGVRNDLVKKQGARLECITGAVIQHKMEGLVHYKKDPDSVDKEVKTIAKVLKSNSYDITIQAILERLETQYDEAKDKSEAAKEKLRKKAEDDQIGGEEIRNASKRGLVKKHQQALTSTSQGGTTTEESDSESKPSSSKHPAKCRRLNSRREDSSSSSMDLLDILKKDAETRGAHAERVEALLVQGAKHAEEMTKIMGGFLNLAENGKL